jgi:hypothetical protein
MGDNVARYNFARPGLGNVGSYQISAIPYFSSSYVVPPTGDEPVEIKFQNVTSFVTVKNTGTPNIQWGFSSAGTTGSVNNNFVVLATDESLSVDFRVSKIYLVSAGAVGAATIIAGLTSITGSDLPRNWSGSVGVG